MNRPMIEELRRRLTDIGNDAKSSGVSLREIIPPDFLDHFPELARLQDTETKLRDTKYELEVSEGKLHDAKRMLEDNEHRERSFLEKFKEMSKSKSKTKEEGESTEDDTPLPTDVRVEKNRVKHYKKLYVCAQEYAGALESQIEVLKLDAEKEVQKVILDTKEANQRDRKADHRIIDGYAKDVNRLTEQNKELEKANQELQNATQNALKAKDEQLSALVVEIRELNRCSKEREKEDDNIEKAFDDLIERLGELNDDNVESINRQEDLSREHNHLRNAAVSEARVLNRYFSVALQAMSRLLEILGPMLPSGDAEPKDGPRKFLRFALQEDTEDKPMSHNLRHFLNLAVEQNAETSSISCSFPDILNLTTQASLDAITMYDHFDQEGINQGGLRKELTGMFLSAIKFQLNLEHFKDGLGGLSKELEHKPSMWCSFKKVSLVHLVGLVNKGPKSKSKRRRSCLWPSLS
ncbi:hypothetical protein BU24DRAFT_472234 [Aaosphaeria arxii CBS 175.79]|uniref:Uncharacterized protein n=1 Tax=Aaosphaeria arxii CBS 175.79 TaxID=1450172 RepID=A0A6A5XE04_9PLEO|nr:uncharacterized protein BU24DRAFT_472234 [Aaosphaeria arxii CBS 175.79]KAF2011093.1 hypothetical protein BU24DRAFT_472234 [Aaosphaeria arxii CBS 175.79]